MCRWAALTMGVVLGASLTGYCGGLSQVEMAIGGLSILLFLGDILNTPAQ
jgi:hypothetical protein